MSLKKLVTIFVLVCFVFGTFFLFSHTTFTPSTWNSKIILSEKTFSVEIADTKELLEKGLSGHTPLLSDQGMLFIFPKLGEYGFWMKDMTFPLDIIWIDSNFTIVHIEKNISPTSYPKVYYPKAQSLYVLEISGGEVDLLTIKIGDSVKLLKK